MNLKELHFAYPLWLWGNLVIPLIWGLFFLFERVRQPAYQLGTFIDSHLLPYLLVNQSGQKRSVWKTVLLWSVVWSCLTLALAGPRWNFREIEMFSRDQSLVILLDLSESMNATDVKPSRLIRAKQKIEDLMNLSKGVKIGLIAFAADPHMIVPITDDKETIRHLLPSLGTDLVYVQGSRLSLALEMASVMLEAEPGNNKALLVMSDGGFEDGSSIGTAKKLTEKGFVIHTMGIGSNEGTPLKDLQGNVIKKDGTPILSRLEKEKLKGVSEVGKGHYFEGHYLDGDEKIILKELEKHAGPEVSVGKKNRVWDESFYWFILPILPIVLWWFRRGFVFSMILTFFIPIFGLQASDSSDYFKNSEELGKEAMDLEDYETAALQFKDSYRKGVAYYRAGNFAEAEKMFLQSSREEVSLNAAYNLGNALALQQKFKEAIKAYEGVLEKCPDCTKAKENLELVKAMLQDQEQEQDSSQSKCSDGQDQKDKGDSQKGDQKEIADSNDSNGKGNKESSNSEKKQDKGESQKKDQREIADSNDLGDKGDKDSSDSEQKQGEENEIADSKDLSGKDPQGPEERKPEIQQVKDTPKEEGEEKSFRSQEDQDADVWLNQISNDQKTFLKNKFQIESKKNGTTRGVDPW